MYLNCMNFSKTQDHELHVQPYMYVIYRPGGPHWETWATQQPYSRQRVHFFPRPVNSARKESPGLATNHTDFKPARVHRQGKKCPPAARTDQIA